MFEFTFEGRESSCVPDVLGEIVADVEAEVCHLHVCVYALYSINCTL